MGRESWRTQGQQEARSTDTGTPGAQGCSSGPPELSPGDNVKDQPRRVHTLNQPQVSKTAIGKLPRSLTAAAPEAKYRKRLSQPFEPHLAVHKTVLYTDISWVRLLSSQETPVSRISMVTTRKAPQSPNTITLRLPRLLALNL